MDAPNIGVEYEHDRDHDVDETERGRGVLANPRGSRSIGSFFSGIGHFLSGVATVIGGGSPAGHEAYVDQAYLLWGYGAGNNNLNWRGFNQVFDFSDASVSWNCVRANASGKDTISTQTGGAVSDSKTSAYCTITFPHLMRKAVTIAADGSASFTTVAAGNSHATTQEIQAAIAALVQRPWVYSPPALMYYFRDGTPTPFTAVSGSFADIVSDNRSIIHTSTFSGTPVNFSVLENLLSSGSAGSVGRSTQDAALDWTQWQSLAKADGKEGEDFVIIRPNDLLWTLMNLSADQASLFPNGFKIRWRQIYDELLRVANASSVSNSIGNGSAGNIPTSMALNVTAYLEYGGNRTTSLAHLIQQSMNAQLNVSDLQASTYQSLDSTSGTWSLYVTEIGITRNEQLINFSNMFSLIVSQGIQCPVDFTLVPANVQDVTFRLGMSFRAMNGTLNYDMGSYTYPFKFANPATADSAHLTVFDLDWKTQVGNVDSSCHTDQCKNEICADGRPVVGTQGSCGKMINDHFLDAESLFHGLINDFNTTTNNAKFSMSTTINSIMGLIDGLRQTTGFKTLPADKQLVYTTFRQNLSTLNTKVQSIYAQWQAIAIKASGSRYDSVVNFGNNLCNLGLTVNQIIQVTTEMKGAYDTIKQEFKTISEELDNDDLSKLVDTNTAFNMTTALNDVNASLSLLFHRMNDQQNAGGNATGGIATNPDADNGFNDAFNSDTGTSGSGDTGADNTVTKKSGWPSWATYVTAGVGVLIIIAVIVGVVIARKSY